MVLLLWTVMVAGACVYALAVSGDAPPWALTLMLSSWAAVLVGNRFFPFDEYHPVWFSLLMFAFLAQTASIVYLTGNRESLLGFLFFAAPIMASAYYGYPGTFAMSLLTGAVMCIPFMSGGLEPVQRITLPLTVLTYVFIGMVSCYVVEGEKMYARESSEYRHLLSLARDREKHLSRLYNLSRRFSYTLDMDTILKTSAALARQMLASEGALVFMIEGGAPVLKAAIGILPFSDMSAVEMPVRTGWVEKLAAGEPVHSDREKLGWLPLPPDRAGKVYGIGAVPVFTGGDVSGYLVCFSAAPRFFRDANLEILETIASQAAVAVEKARLYSTTLDDKTKVETILGALRDGLVLTDAAGRLVEINPVAERMLSIEAPVDRLVLSDALRAASVRGRIGDMAVDEAVEDALGGKTVFGEMTFSGDEQRMTVQAQLIPLYDQLARVSGLVLFMHDITELKNLDEMKSNFVSNVSHELRTPLTSISGFVSLLLAGRTGELSKSQREYLEIVKQQTGHLTGIIEDLLDLSMMRAGRATHDSRPIDLQELLRTAEAHFKKASADRDVVIRVHERDGIPLVDADPGRITQVLSNIIGNALKFTPPGGLVEITAFDLGSSVQVGISDTGSGIPESALPHIFNRFFQAHPADSSKSGFGLGLAITREIIEMHGGKIWAESDPGRGSTFYFTLPVRKEA